MLRAYSSHFPVASYRRRVELLPVSQCLLLLCQFPEFNMTVTRSEGTARMTLFASSGNARTFNYQPGDIGTSGTEERWGISN